jgi:hypothetical protein
MDPPVVDLRLRGEVIVETEQEFARVVRLTPVAT